MFALVNIFGTEDCVGDFTGSTIVSGFRVTRIGASAGSDCITVCTGIAISERRLSLAVSTR